MNDRKELTAVNFMAASVKEPAKRLVANLYILSGDLKKPKKTLIASAVPDSLITESLGMVHFCFPAPIHLTAGTRYTVIPELV